MKSILEPRFKEYNIGSPSDEPISIRGIALTLRIRLCVGRLLLFQCLISFWATNQLAGQTTGKTRIVLLGTGAPAPDAEHSGPATAIVVNDAAYLVDLGPGIVRRASAAFGC